MPDQIITREGYEKLRKELEFLLNTKRKEIADRIEKAKELGDLSENAEYADAKEALAFNDGRIMDIKALLKNLTVVDNGNHGDTIGMGSIVTVGTNGSEKKYTLVSFNEVDPLDGKISNESPLGKAFIGKKKGDIVVVSTPKGDVEYKITKVE
jgi:transcription elongation factor GreA